VLLCATIGVDKKTDTQEQKMKIYKVTVKTISEECGEMGDPRVSHHQSENEALEIARSDGRTYEVDGRYLSEWQESLHGQIVDGVNKVRTVGWITPIEVS
jgi:hypothetical protein